MGTTASRPPALPLEDWEVEDVAPSPSSSPIRVAVIGAGVAGLGAAWHLSKRVGVELTVFEASEAAGGHASTVDVEVDGRKVAVDTGFQVFNHQNYPNMVALFRELGVGEEDTDMSFSVSIDGGRMEWSSANVNALFAARANALRPTFYGMLNDMARFNREAPLLLQLDDDDPRKSVTVREYLKTHGYGDAFYEWYLQPMAAALWSSSDSDVRDFSAVLMVSFFFNHNMLQIFGRPQWKTPAGRSRKYVKAICQQLGSRLLLNTPVNKVYLAEADASSGASGASAIGAGDGAAAEKWVVEVGGEKRVFDKVIFACHTDQSLEILGDKASPEEAEALGSLAYAENVVYLHSDERLMPRRRRAWASWNYMSDPEEGPAAEAATVAGGSKPVFVTYWLNKLQNLNTPTQIFISLNPTLAPDPATVYRRMTYSHPQLTPAGARAQKRLGTVNGQRGLWFCGAWTGYGFHEDGLRSGLEAACAITGQPVPWAPRSAPPSPVPSATNIAAAAAASPASSSPPSRAAAAGVLTVGSGSSSGSSGGGGGGGSGGGDVARRPRQSNRVMVLPQRAAPLPLDPARALRRTLAALLQSLAYYSIKQFLSRSIHKGCLVLRLPDGRRCSFGDAACQNPDHNVTVRVFDWSFFVKVALEYDLGLARSYMAGEWTVDGDTVYADGLRRLFLLFVLNRDAPQSSFKAGRLLLSWIGSTINYVRYKLSMDNSLSGSRSNIHAHYDLSNDLFTTFLDKEVMMYSSAIYDAELDPARPGHLVFKDTLESAQLRKVDTLLDRARVQRGHRLLDIGFGWGGIAIRAVQRFGCRVHGITLSIEQKVLAEQRVRERGLEDLITFELVDYRVFAKNHPGEFDRIISCEMIEAVGHNYLGTFFSAVERLLKPDGIFVMEAITTPESRYDEYLRSTDFINTIIFPGSCCPSLAALLQAMADNSNMSLESYDNIGMHYAETLREWRYRFNDNLAAVHAQGFDSTFVRCWNYYFTYCEAGFHSQTEGCLILTFSRPGNTHLLLSSETRAIVGHR